MNASYISVNWDLFPYYAASTILVTDSLRNAYGAVRELNKAIFLETNDSSTEAVANQTAHSYFFGTDSIQARSRHFLKAATKLSVAIIEGGVSYLVLPSSSKNNHQSDGSGYPYTVKEKELLRFRYEVIEPAIKASDIIKSYRCLNEHANDPYVHFLEGWCADKGYYSELLSDEERKYHLAEGYQCTRQAALTGLSNILNGDEPTSEKISTGTPPLAQLPSQNKPKPARITMQENLDKPTQSAPVAAELKHLPPLKMPAPAMGENTREELITDLAPRAITQEEIEALKQVMLDEKIAFTAQIAEFEKHGKALRQIYEKRLDYYVKTKMTGRHFVFEIRYDEMCDLEMFKIPALEFIGLNDEYMCGTYNEHKNELEEIKRKQKQIANLFPTVDNTNCQILLDEMLSDNDMIRKYLPPNQAEGFIKLRNEMNAEN